MRRRRGTPLSCIISKCLSSNILNNETKMLFFAFFDAAKQHLMIVTIERHWVIGDVLGEK